MLEEVRGFLQKVCPKNYEALSAGTEPVGNLNPLAIDIRHRY
jgi:hypothetical protein